MSRNARMFLSLALTALSACGIGASAQVARPAPAATVAPAPAAMAHGVTTKSAEAESAQPNDATHQGIKIHGHWKIVIRNADGTVAQTREFENSIGGSGATLLSRAITGMGTAGEKSITLLAANSNTASLCGEVACVIDQYANGAYATLCSNSPSIYACTTGLTISAGTDGGGFPISVIFTGQMTASQSGSISQVQTGVSECSQNGFMSTSTLSPSACASATSGIEFGVLTGTTISTISVTAGQVVQVMVTLTFS